MITDNQLKNIYNQGWDDASEGKDSREFSFRINIQKFAYLEGYNDYSHNELHPSADEYMWEEKLDYIKNAFYK